MNRKQRRTQAALQRRARNAQLTYYVDPTMPEIEFQQFCLWAESQGARAVRDNVNNDTDIQQAVEQQDQ